MAQSKKAMCASARLGGAQSRPIFRMSWSRPLQVRRMRPIKISLMLVASAALWACADDAARTETAVAHARDSGLAHDLVLAGYDSAVVSPANRKLDAPATGARTVAVAPGDLAAADHGTDSSTASTGSSTSV